MNMWCVYRGPCMHSLPYSVTPLSNVPLDT